MALPDVASEAYRLTVRGNRLAAGRERHNVITDEGTGLDGMRGTSVARADPPMHSDVHFDERFRRSAPVAGGN